MLVKSSPSGAPAIVGPNLAFPLCRDAGHEATIRRVLGRCTQLLLERLPQGTLVALVLTGSFARGEGTVMASHGHARVLGDIEFLVVFPSEVEFHTFRGRMAAWSHEASRAVASEIRVDIEFGPADLSYLCKRARPSIFVHDLIRHGKVVWGRPDVLGEVSPFGVERIPREDAFALACNRTIEQLEAYDRLAEVEGEALWDLAYRRLKLVLDLAGSALAFAGRHTASYEARPSEWAHLVTATPALARTMPTWFQAELERAARLKAMPGDGTMVLPRLPLDEQRAWIRRQIVESTPAITALLTWELEQLLGVSGQLPSLLRRYLAAQPFSRRVWDWAKVALHPAPPPVPLSRLRAMRLFFQSTPRALLYVAGILATLNFVRPTVRPRAITRLIFARRAVLRRDPVAHRRAITALWRWCVRNT